MNHFKFLITCLFISLSISVQAKKIKIEGKVENPTSTSVAIKDLNNQEIASDEMNKNGLFKMSMKLEGGYYQLIMVEIQYTFTFIPEMIFKLILMQKILKIHCLSPERDQPETII